MNQIIPSYFKIETQPIPDPSAIVCASGARFTILTSRLLRLEYHPQEKFEDRASQIFWFRLQPVPAMEVKRLNGWLEVRTQDLILRYREGQPFSPDTLQITLRASKKIWRFGDEDSKNLQGTYRTLDNTSGPIKLDPGLLSRNGWVTVNDTNSLVFNVDGWLEVREILPESQDIYFFGYGKDYQSCLRDFSKIAGATPLIPRWALGNWWSRYWTYSQSELLQLMFDFQAHQVPLSVCIVDMDWHLTETGNDSVGWTGYTWNKALFPDPASFLASLHEIGLKTALNLHPADGIYPHEERYAPIAEALGLDPCKQIPIPFDPTNPAFVRVYFDILHHPLEDQGVDFWWMDWQQGNPTRLTGLNLLWWINHLHSIDLGRNATKRPFIFSRWGGLGNHRYPIGFSGDTHVTWNSLAYQPFYTATAANVGYGWWSHDIGGHMGGVEDAELYTRWVQFGVFSPIFRLHSTKNPFHERRPWGFDAETERITRSALQLRHALIPYLYSMAWRNYEQAIALVRPMYHLFPEHEEAYSCPNQYLFGSELIAAPYIQPIDSDTRLSRQVIWLPPGMWFDFFGAQSYKGDCWIAVYGAQEDIPIFAKAGAIIPLAPRVGWGGIENPDHLDVHVYPGADNHFDLWEDDGVSSFYRKSIYAILPFQLNWFADHLMFEVSPVRGMQSVVPQCRSIRLIFHMLIRPNAVDVFLNGSLIDLAWFYEADTGNVILNSLYLSPNDHLQIIVKSDNESMLLVHDTREFLIQKFLRSFRLGTDSKKVLVTQTSALLENPERLANYQFILTPTQKRALLETITGAGVEEIRNIGEPLIICWNNEQIKLVGYEKAIERLYIYQPEFRFGMEKGKLPKFQVIHPDIDWGHDPTVLTINYGGILKVVLTHRLIDGQHHIKAGLY